MLASKPGWPSSATVGTSGRAGLRRSDITAIGRTLPLLANGTAGGGIEVLAIGTWPLTTACVAAAGWNGTCVMSTLASARNSHSAPRCVVVPLPDDAYESLPARASVSSSASEPALTSGCT